VSKWKRQKSSLGSNSGGHYLAAADGMLVLVSGISTTGIRFTRLTTEVQLDASFAARADTLGTIISSSGARQLNRCGKRVIISGEHSYRWGRAPPRGFDPVTNWGPPARPSA
jgi:hypothetical protein